MKKIVALCFAVALAASANAGCWCILMGFGLEQNAIHSPNESMDLEVWEKGIIAVTEFYKEYAK